MSPAIATDAVVTKARASDAPATFQFITRYGQFLYGQWPYGFNGPVALTPKATETVLMRAIAKEALL